MKLVSTFPRSTVLAGVLWLPAGAAVFYLCLELGWFQIFSPVAVQALVLFSVTFIAASMQQIFTIVAAARAISATGALWTAPNVIVFLVGGVSTLIALLCAVSAVLYLVGACVDCSRKEGSPVWKAAVSSPGGEWVATAETVQKRGFGSGCIDTSVYLRRSNDTGPSVQVLGFVYDGPVPHPYTLDNTLNRGGAIGLDMKWVDASHLHVTFSNYPHLYFRSGYEGVDVIAEGLSRPNR